ncbi:MAG: hypothetical protein K2P93_01595 [Alphaproteobacteria bacterium]|nr:hypothetical protein [Alphaproteobacteria bacterium]
MKNYLSNFFLLGASFLSLTFTNATAQPIQLVPKTDNSPLSFTPRLPLQEEMGFWEGTPPTVFETYFQPLPIGLISPVLQTMRNAILKEKYTPLLNNTFYQQTLFSHLIESGQLKEAEEFLLGTSLAEKEILLINLQWLESEQKKACEKITNLMRSSANSEWKKQNIYCLYLNGEKERGKIAAELLSESNPSDFPLIGALFDSSSHPHYEDSIGKSPFLLTVWCATGQDIPEDALIKLSPSTLALIAHAEKIPLGTRLAAGERAIMMGTLEGDFVLNLLKDASSRGFLEKFIEALKPPKAETLLSLFEEAHRSHKLGLLGKVFKPILSKIAPSPETLELAPYLVRSFLEGGEKDLAQKWGTYFMREAPDEAVSILPLLHLAFPQNKWGEPQLKAWQTYQTRIHPQDAMQNSYILRRLLEVLGESPGPAIKGEPNAPSWRQEKLLFDEKALDLLDSAATSKRKGEVFLLVLSLIGKEPLQDLSPDKLIRLISSLTKAGCKEEARSLALEFLLAKGI